MKKHIAWGVLVSIPLSASLVTEWQYSRAVHAAQRDDWKEAQQRMSTLVVDDPDNASLLYDNGVAAYRMKEYVKAAAYFEQALQQKNASLSLQEQVRFNLGNTQVALNHFEDAIHCYEEVLKMNPSNEQAQHNVQKVREYLAQQKQQQQKQNSTDKNESNKKESQNQRDTQKNEDEQKQEKGQRNEQQSSQNQQGTSNQHEQLDDQSDDQQHDTENTQGVEDGDEQGESAHKKQEQQGANQNEGNDKDQADNESQHDSNSQQQERNGNTHNSSPQQHRMSKESLKKGDADDHHTQEGGKSQGMQEGELDDQIKLVQAHQKDIEDMLDPKDQWMARILRQREHADEQANKRIVKAMIHRELAGKNGQNCW